MPCLNVDYYLFEDRINGFIKNAFVEMPNKTCLQGICEEPEERLLVRPLQKDLSNLDLTYAWRFCFSHSSKVWTLVKTCNTHYLDLTY